MDIVSVVNNIVSWTKPNIYRKILLITSLVFAQLSLGIAVYYSGGTKCSYPYLMILILTAGSFLFGIRGGLGFGCTAGIIFGPLMPMDTKTMEMQTLFNWIFRTGFYMIFGLLSGGIMEYLLRTLEKIKTVTLYNQNTKLPNRKYFEHMATIEDPDTYLAVIKIEEYSNVVQSLGYEFATELVKNIATELRDRFGKVYYQNKCTT